MTAINVIKFKSLKLLQINPSMDSVQYVGAETSKQTRRNHQQMRRKRHKGGETGGHMNTAILRCPVLSAAGNHAP